MSADLPSGASANSLTPEVTWAQRSSKTEADKNFIYLTIVAPDVPKKDMKLDLQPGSLAFSGHSLSKKTNYSVKLELFADIDPAASKIRHNERDIEIRLQKKELDEKYWPRLLKDGKKAHYLKTDFDKWVDEDDQNEVPEDDYMNQFGADGGFGNLDFSKLGGGAGMGDMGGGDGSDDDMEEGDDDMPGLEGDEKDEADGKASAGESSSSGRKIEEVE